MHRDVLYTILHFSFIPHSAATPFLTHTCVINSSLKHSIKIPHGPVGKRRDIVWRLLFFPVYFLSHSPFSTRDTCSVYLIPSLSLSLSTHPLHPILQSSVNIAISKLQVSFHGYEKTHLLRTFPEKSEACLPCSFFFLGKKTAKHDGGRRSKGETSGGGIEIKNHSPR